MTTVRLNQEFPEDALAVLVKDRPREQWVRGDEIEIQYDDNDIPAMRLYLVAHRKTGTTGWVDRSTFELWVPDLADVEAVESWLGS